jgi:electron transport complex protein RnfC
VDCIAILPLPEARANWTQAMADAARARFQFRAFRLERETAERTERLARKAREQPAQAMPEQKKAMILAAIERAKARRAGVTPKNTDALPPAIQAQIAAIDARRAAAKKR